MASLVFCLVLFLASCVVRKEERSNSSGDEPKKVDIQTPFGGIHVATNAQPQDTGIPAYPGARVKPAGEQGRMHDTKAANVTIDTGGFGMRVVAIEYESDDPPQKVIDFYKNELKKFGDVLECPKGVSDHGDLRLTCSDSGSTEPGKMDVAVGSHDRERLVSVKPRGSGTEFALVYIQKRGKDTL